MAKETKKAVAKFGELVVLNGDTKQAEAFGYHAEYWVDDPNKVQSITIQDEEGNQRTVKESGGRRVVYAQIAVKTSAIDAIGTRFDNKGVNLKLRNGASVLIRGVTLKEACELLGVAA